MRKASAAAVLAAASFAMTFGAPMAAEAKTVKEMKVCWTAPKGSSNYSIKVALDGPTSRSTWLKSGACKSWNVKPGKYKVVWANVNDLARQFDDARSRPFPEFDATSTSICGTHEQNNVWYYFDANATVKRFQNAYQTYELRDGSGAVETTIQDQRQTKVNFRTACYQNLD